MAQEPVRSLSAWADLGGQVHVRWLTAAPAVCEVVLDDQRIPEDPSCLRGTTNNRDAGTGFAVNHRADFPAPRTWPLSLTVTGRTRDGVAFTSPAVQVKEPAPPRGTVARAQITGAVDAGGWSAARIPVTFGVPLPPGQLGLEAAYKDQLRARFGIEFDNLITITNMPIARFLHDLERAGRRGEYELLLLNSFNRATVEGLMCRRLVSVGWDGRLYDCDFNQMLDIELLDEVDRATIHAIDAVSDLSRRPIATANHCFGCTAGAGSSCGGALAG